MFAHQFNHLPPANFNRPGPDAQFCGGDKRTGNFFKGLIHKLMFFLCLLWLF